VCWFSVDLVAQESIQYPICVDVKKNEVAILHLHGEKYIPVKAIQMVKKPLQLLCYM